MEVCKSSDLEQSGTVVHAESAAKLFDTEVKQHNYVGETDHNWLKSDMSIIEEFSPIKKGVASRR